MPVRENSLGTRPGTTTISFADSRRRIRVFAEPEERDVARRFASRTAKAMRKVPQNHAADGWAGT